MKKVIAPIIIGILVILIGVKIIIDLISFLNRKFKPEPPAPTLPNASNVVQQANIPLQARPGLAWMDADLHRDIVSRALDWGCAFSFTLIVLPDGSLQLVPGTNLQLTVGMGGTQQTESYYSAVIEQSVDCSRWLPVLTVIQPASKAAEFTLPGPCSQSFWRARKQ